MSGAQTPTPGLPPCLRASAVPARAVPPRRRAFTLVEVILASALGTLVILGAAGVVAMLNRSDTSLRDRFDQTTSLARAQVVFRRIFSTVVMSNDQKPRGYQSSGTRAMSEENQREAERRAAEGNTDLPTPRFIVTPDERFIAARRMLDGAGNPMTPQRIEAVVSQPPLVSSLAPAEILEDRSLAQIVRGALEVRPSVTRAGTPCWAVWWIPLLETEQGWVPMTDDAGVTLGDKVMDGVASIRWTVYDDRVRKREFSAIWYDELPAYVNVEITTTAGLYAEWMFDVSWFIGPDSQNSILPDEQPQTNTPTGAGGGGGGGGEGGAGRGRGGEGGGGAPTRGPGRPRGRPAGTTPTPNNPSSTTLPPPSGGAR